MTFSQEKKILIVVEGSSDLKNYAMGDGRQLATLLGHFSAITTLKGVNNYIPHELDIYDYTFYIGFTAKNTVPLKFLEDVYATTKQIIWLNTGFEDFSKKFDVKKKFGFSVSGIDSLSNFDIVKSANKTFSKEEHNTALIEIQNRTLVRTIATVLSSKKKREAPYIVQSGNLMYIGDSPFASATETDRYLLFADMLHDILGEEHESSHSAIIRIEDVDPLQNPDNLREIADILSSRGIPFLVGVIPFYVDPGTGTRVALSDKPNFVDALHYMVRNGATIVMHGVTHQYKGVTGADFEFWDASTNKPIKGETPEGVARKIETGIQEFMKNGLYPLVWETPHYTASFTLYSTVAKYFSTACEQRLAIEDAEYGQYFPYIIKKDLFGQTIYPENLGYVPLTATKEEGQKYVQNIIKNSASQLNVRDGFASMFFHSFLNLDLLKELVDGIEGQGFTFIDLSETTNRVQMKDRVILSGSQEYTITLNDQYLAEAYYDASGEVKDKIISDARVIGKMTRPVTLAPGEIYKAEPTEFHETKVPFLRRLFSKAKKLYNSLFSIEESWNEPRVAILWNHFARGAAHNDQASFAAAFASVNIKVDTIFLDQPINLSRYNLLIVPYAFVDSLSDEDYTTITTFVASGGNIITDLKNDLAEELGIKFIDSRIKVSHVRDHYFPEEAIAWNNAQLVNRFDTEELDEVFCSDEVTDAPMVIGKKCGNGKMIFFGSLFDPYTQHGYSLYPYLLEYVRKYFSLRPVVRRENLEVYFDPGFRHTYSIEQLVKQWSDEGIRIVHAAGWHEYPKYTYDYERLIRVAHANGILVFAWLEPPQVSQKFWNEHPQWREKNFKGEDVRPSWRYPVALTDKSCLVAMAEVYRNTLERFDFDGVNLAELYFEAGRGFSDAKLFTPMHPSAEMEVQRMYGFSLAEIFDPASLVYWKNNEYVRASVVEYRVKKLSEAYEIFLGVCDAIAKKKNGFQVIVTAMDNYGNPELRTDLGVDMRTIIALQREKGFFLQVEDPESAWSGDPSRYIEMGRRYKALISDSTKLLLDLNILTFRAPGTVNIFPTLIQTGTESFELVRSASLGAPRATIYSESSVNPQDMSFMASALAGDVRYQYRENGYQFSSPYSFVLRMPAWVKELALDGSPLPEFRANEFMIPAGEHVITVSRQPQNRFSTHELKTRILSCTGNLLSISYGVREITFSYESAMRTLVAFNAEPTSILLDGEKYQCDRMKGNDCFTIFLPPGRHRVSVVTGDKFSYGVNLTSLWSSNAIAMFGVLAVGLLVVLYLVLKIIKRRA